MYILLLIIFVCIFIILNQNKDGPKIISVKHFDNEGNEKLN